MPDRTACKFCGKVGFVRRENVLNAGRSIVAFYCGSCNRSWQEGEEGRAPDDVKRAAGKKRQRS
jgi:hypothetical protein